VIPQLRLWINDGALDGDVGETEPITTPKAFPYTIPGQYLALPRSAQEPDLVIGTNVYGHGITFDPASSDLPVLWSSGVDTATVGATLKRAELIRVTEGDALVTKLLLSYGSTGSGNPVVRVCSLDDPFHPDCQPVMHGFACVDGAVLRMGTGGEQVSRLIALCREGSVGDATGVLVEVDTSVMPFTTTPLRMPKGDANGNLIRTGDVTGDAIDDVLVLDRVQGLAEIRVYPQCNTRDTRCGEQP
jgi:hypothetical protein